MQNPEAGKPLSGPLRGCHSIRLGGSENRIVYRIVQTVSDREEDIVGVIAIGRRREGEVHDTAAARV